MLIYILSLRITRKINTVNVKKKQTDAYEWKHTATTVFIGNILSFIVNRFFLKKHKMNSFFYENLLSSEIVQEIKCSLRMSKKNSTL